MKSITINKLTVGVFTKDVTSKIKIKTNID